MIDSSTAGYPFKLAHIPAGDYYMQSVLNVYTQFYRADGHMIWAHKDQWEGQQWNRSPGNLVSDVQRVHIDPRTPETIRIALTHVIAPLTLPADTKWVKHVKIQSKLRISSMERGRSIPIQSISEICRWSMRTATRALSSRMEVVG